MVAVGLVKKKNKASVDQSLRADAAKREAAEQAAKVKREDIGEALEARRTGEGRGGGGGRGRRSLFRSGGSGAGFIGRLMVMDKLAKQYIQRYQKAKAFARTMGSVV